MVHFWNDDERDTSDYLKSSSHVTSHSDEMVLDIFSIMGYGRQRNIFKDIACDLDKNADNLCWNEMEYRDYTYEPPHAHDYIYHQGLEGDYDDGYDDVTDEVTEDLTDAELNGDAIESTQANISDGKAGVKCNKNELDNEADTLYNTIYTNKFMYS
jgi:hypothetical protein